MKIYILGLRRKGDDHYSLTTWLGEAPIYYAIYDRNPGYWKSSEQVEPIAVDTEEKLLKMEGWEWIGFGWKIKNSLSNSMKSRKETR